MADRPISFWVWQPQKMLWWVATLFMIGASLFALGCVMALRDVTNDFAMRTVFFTGSLFFTSAAYCELRLTSLANPVEHASAISQFIGTLLFNANTFDSFFDLRWFVSDTLVWSPNIFGSIMFLISAALVMLHICKRWWSWNFRSLVWWNAVINYAGCVAFMISAILSFTLPAPLSGYYDTLATVFTLIGALCFFVGAYMMWPEMSRND